MSGRMMLRALIEGKATPQEMAELAKGAILERALEIVVANAQHIKKVPGRKTDVKGFYAKRFPNWSWHQVLHFKTF
jgi:3-hydroxyacyl-CoA dehydrogenase